MISIERSETAQKVHWKSETNSVEDKMQSKTKFSPRHNSVQKIFFLTRKKNFWTELCLGLNFVLDSICLGLNFVLDSICLRLHTAVVFRMQSFNLCFVGVRGVLLLTENKVMFEVFQAVYQYYDTYNNSSRVQFILGPGFQDKPEYNKVFKYIRGALFLKPSAVNLSDFKEHFLTLNPIDHKINPWFANYWNQEYIECPHWEKRVSCSADIETRRRNFRLANNVQDTLVAVETYAHALKHAHTELCGNISGMCSSLSTINRSQLDSFLQPISFLSEDGVQISRQEDGSLTQRSYDVMNIQRDGTSYTSVKVKQFTQMKFYHNP